MSQFFYFVCYTDADQTKVTVVDLHHTVEYKRSDFAYVNLKNFDNHLDAISYARRIAEKYGLGYKRFDSGYDESLNEFLTLEED